MMVMRLEQYPRDEMMVEDGVSSPDGISRARMVKNSVNTTRATGSWIPAFSQTSLFDEPHFLDFLHDGNGPLLSILLVQLLARHFR